MNRPTRSLGFILASALFASASAGELYARDPNRDMRVQFFGTVDDDLRSTLGELVRRAGLIPFDGDRNDAKKEPAEPFATLVIDRTAPGWTQVTVSAAAPVAFHVRRALARRDSATLEDEEIRLVVRSILDALVHSEAPTQAGDASPPSHAPVPTTDAGFDAVPPSDAGLWADSEVLADAPRPAPASEVVTSVPLVQPVEDQRPSPKQSTPSARRVSYEFSLAPFGSFASFAAGHPAQPGGGAAFEWTYTASVLRPSLSFQTLYQAATVADDLGIHVRVTPWPMRLYGSVAPLRSGRFSLRTGAGAGVEFVFSTADAMSHLTDARTPPVYAMATVGTELRADVLVTDGLSFFASGILDALVNRPRFVVVGAESGTVVTPLAVREVAEVGVSFRLGSRGAE